jgi:hypothetical protein
LEEIIKTFLPGAIRFIARGYVSRPVRGWGKKSWQDAKKKVKKVLDIDYKCVLLTITVVFFQIMGTIA